MTTGQSLQRSITPVSRPDKGRRVITETQSAVRLAVLANCDLMIIIFTEISTKQSVSGLDLQAMEDYIFIVMMMIVIFVVIVINMTKIIMMMIIIIIIIIIIIMI